MKRDLVKEPYEMFSIWLYVLASIILGCLTFGFCIALVNSSNLVAPSLNKVVCTSFNTMDKWLYGDSRINWDGIEKFDDNLESI